MTADSSPLVTRYVCTDGADKGVEFYHATSASDAIEGKDSVQLTEGTSGDHRDPHHQPRRLNHHARRRRRAGRFRRIEGLRPTGVHRRDEARRERDPDDIDKVLDKVNEAISKGDGTLTGMPARTW